MRFFFYILVSFLLPVPVAALDLKVDVGGLESELEANVRAFLSIEQERQHEGLTVSRLRLLHDKAPEEIRQALQPFGYFAPKIKSELETLEASYLVRYRIDSGSQVPLSEVDFQITGDGANDPMVTERFPLSVGDALDLVLYEQAKQSILSRVTEKGYLEAHYTAHEVRVDRDNYTARIKLHLETGMRFRFGEIRFEQEILNPEFLARYLSFGSGDPYSYEKLLDLQGKLIDSEYFKQVEVNSRRDQIEGDQIPVDILLSPNKKNRYRIGLGYSTDTGPRLTLDWKRRRIGREGHHMRSELRLSGPEKSLTSEYIIPLARPTVDYISFGASLDYYDLDTSKGNRALLNASHSVDLDRGWRRTLTLDYLYEDSEVGSQDDNARLLVPGITWSRIKGGSREYVTKGKLLEFHIEGASDSVLSTTSYVQLYTRDKFIHSLNDDWRVLARIELGATWADELTELPPSKRFYAGGDNSVRGFGYEDLGPRDGSAEVIGGRYLAVGSLEIERRFAGKWSGALFLDSGNAFDPDFDAEVAYGFGLGVRWRSPVGPLRFDLARGHYLDDRTLRLHVVLGPEL
ncbi:MAG: autotransporter assembly complex protein TamA [Candidatus Thiodiazotropha sp. (ex Gloverina cf. vestifex)]|nr:autotransporter assembly complex protein TamA [Candidatus Thiodiazotropha sp. (ex Gloverina cf. vestifex)]